jgi:hypothetical protein
MRKAGRNAGGRASSTDRTVDGKGIANREPGKVERMVARDIVKSEFAQPEFAQPLVGPRHSMYTPIQSQKEGSGFLAIPLTRSARPNYAR